MKFWHFISRFSTTKNQLQKFFHKEENFSDKIVLYYRNKYQQSIYSIMFAIISKCKDYKYKKSFPTPGIEPGPPAWKARILTTRPYGIGYFSLILLILFKPSVLFILYASRTENICCYAVFTAIMCCFQKHCKQSK